ncbi:MAG: heavy metal translocating P-type ATPase [Jaaginema sp. PMC 1079.18]|nr:heavy metal translocating P-type ATPase [Jaaginema sp. PMC 1080.18]MEC4849691.1 heavy metal translocating P-type ATPase [Jaaginema sp. PMC 1079.18]MEC4867964.1 heavy metal translocating P-type ATPase [Jaaginema sp. PMC 1078.18]
MTKTVTLDVKGMKCAGCVKSVERQLLQNSGVISAQVNLITEVAVVQYDVAQIQPDAFTQKLSDRGFPSQIRSNQTVTKPNPETDKPKQKSAQTQLAIAVILLLFSGLGHWQHWGGPAIPIVSNIWFHGGLATLALLLPGREIIIDGARGLRYGMPNMNTLVGLGTVSAYLASCIALFWPQLGWECFFDEPVMLLGFILLGRILEKRARHQASEALQQLLALQPTVVRLIGQSDQNEEMGIEIPVAQARSGEWVRVLPGERIPIDGEVVSGETAVDESILTGESMPVLKQVGDSVAAGTLNQGGAIALCIQRSGQDTTLARAIALVEAAQTRKAPVQQLADTVAGYFAYGVMAIASLTFVFWYFLGTAIWPQVLTPMAMAGMHATAPSGILLSLKLAIAVLVVACPCALGLATPTAILVGTSLGAEQGILIKGGDILEQVRDLDAIVFDKTGTLTLGKLQVTGCFPEDNWTADTLLQYAATAESGTNHPLAKAMLNGLKARDLPLLRATDFETKLGWGIAAQVNQKPVFVGNIAWLEKQNIALPALNTDEPKVAGHQTLVYVAVDGQLAGAIALEDELRPDAQITVSKLQEMGLEVMLLTGDRPTVANAIAAQLGIDRWWSQVPPDGKVEVIQELQKHQQVGMVGDGINDAPALAQAHIGISLHDGTDIAIETAGIVLMGGTPTEPTSLLKVVRALQLSRATFGKIRQNLFWALGYNAIAIPIAAGALLPGWGLVLSPAIAGGFMAFSSVMVVTNSLGLRQQFRRDRIPKTSG